VFSDFHENRKVFYKKQREKAKTANNHAPVYAELGVGGAFQVGIVARYAELYKKVLAELKKHLNNQDVVKD
jgi:hypothetical protein